MGNFSKKIRDNQDKAILRQKFGKSPKHRCKDCHRFTFWVSDEKTKRQCVWCKIEMEKYRRLIDMNNIIEFPKRDADTIMCRECKIRPATRLCDYEDGLLFDAPDRNGIKRPVQRSRCSKPLCDKCTHKLNKEDYCLEHWNLIKEEVQKDGI